MGIFNWISSKQLEKTERELGEVKKEYQTLLRESANQRSLNRTLKEELEDLKLKKKIEEEDIKHMVKIKLDQNEIEFQKKTLTVEQEKDNAISDIKQQYADKLQSRAEGEIKNIKEMYGQILERLPNMSVRLKGDL